MGSTVPGRGAAWIGKSVLEEQQVVCCSSSVKYLRGCVGQGVGGSERGEKAEMGLEKKIRTRIRY